jgi:hypothetical protein
MRLCKQSSKWKDVLVSPLPSIQTTSGTNPHSCLIDTVDHSHGVKRPRQQIDNFCLAREEVKNEWSCTSATLICLSDLDRVNVAFLSLSFFDCHHLRKKALY